MEFRDYYGILGVSPDADDKAIKAASRKLARKYHPDVSSEEDAAEKFKEISEAYQVLRDPEKRAEYDQMRQYGHAGVGAGGGEPPPGWEQYRGFGGGWSAEGVADEDLSDLFEHIFGGARRQRRWSSAGGGAARGQDLEMDLPIFLEEAAAGEQKEISYRVPQYDGSGRRQEDATKTVRVRIPKGATDGQLIRLKGQGAPAPGEGAAGDLYLRIRLAPHPMFDVEERDLIVTVPVAPWEAALGTKVEVPTLDGSIRLSVPAGSQTGRRLRARGKGLPADKGAGDLYAVLKVVMPPDAPDTDTAALWEQLAEKADFDPRAEWRRKA